MRTGYVAGPLEFRRDAEGRIVGWRRDVMEYSTLSDKPHSHDLGMAEAEDSGDWEDYDLITECNRCGEKRPCIKRYDPFIAEVYPEDLDEAEKTYWCEDCFGARVAQV